MYISLVKCESSKHLFNIKTCWQSLFWSKIHLRILMLIKQIFIETKKHNLSYVYKLQNYLINSNELKLFELNAIISKTYFFYYKKEKKNT
uniref:Putative group II intron reverse transcriptase/maturase protein n=1 Tax=Vertebrata lanosa TaxID=1261582 RepID=A0A0B5VUW5_9FLOR|nr:putative group II intron reverse transcriptase/maturase protein [Vertebrata lanosa]AJH65983.1 putative group II intron reverse transcriptase/maturase protein [Vertebrata lanosa]